MTLPQLEVDLATCFEAGQAYVALSRAVSMGTTRILSFNPASVKTNRQVVEFYETLAPLAAAQPTAHTASTSGTRPGLTPEQLARIEANKAKALARRGST